MTIYLNLFENKEKDKTTKSVRSECIKIINRFLNIFPIKTL